MSLCTAHVRFGPEGDITKTDPFPSTGADCYRYVPEPPGATMRRRDFIIAGSLVAAWPLAARAQQTATPVVGFLSSASHATMQEYIVAYKRGLADGGFTEGRNVAIEYRWSEGHNERLP